MEEKYKYLFMKYIYKKLNLQEIEKKISDNNIKNQEELEQNTISKYFVLLNNVNIEKLTGSLKEKFDYYFSMSLDELCSSNLTVEINSFLEDTYKLLLFPDISIPYYYYGPINYKYMAPSDSIVLGFCYNEFDIPNDNFDEIHFQRETFLDNCLNLIQYEIASKAGFKVAIIKYNEFMKTKLK